MEDDSDLDDDYESDSEYTYDPEQMIEIGVPSDYASLGPPTATCEKCQAIMWKEERVNKNVKHGTARFSLCCGQGQVKLPTAPATPSYLHQLYNDPKKGKHFKRCIRLYNSMFTFTSMGGRVDHSINSGRGPYVYRLNGQNHHVFGSLIPNKGQDPKFCQLYIYDTDNELENRVRWVNTKDGEAVDKEIVQGLIEMLDKTNGLVKHFRSARDRFQEKDIVDMKTNEDSWL